MTKFLSEHTDINYKVGSREFPKLADPELKVWKTRLNELTLDGGFNAGAAFDGINRDTFKCNCVKEKKKQ